VSKFWICLKRRARLFLLAAVLIVLGLVAIAAYPVLVATEAPGWLLILPRVVTIGPWIGLALALVLAGAAALGAFGGPRGPQPR
jgi:hypothetical protein